MKVSEAHVDVKKAIDRVLKDQSYSNFDSLDRALAVLIETARDEGRAEVAVNLSEARQLVASMGDGLAVVTDVADVRPNLDRLALLLRGAAQR